MRNISRCTPLNTTALELAPPTPLVGVERRFVTRNQPQSSRRPHPARRGGAEVRGDTIRFRHALQRCDEPALHPDKRGGGGDASQSILVMDLTSTPASGVGRHIAL